MIRQASYHCVRGFLSSAAMLLALLALASLALDVYRTSTGFLPPFPFPFQSIDDLYVKLDDKHILPPAEQPALECAHVSALKQVYVIIDGDRLALRQSHIASYPIGYGRQVMIEPFIISSSKGREKIHYYYRHSDYISFGLVTFWFRDLTYVLNDIKFSFFLTFPLLLILSFSSSLARVLCDGNLNLQKEMLFSSLCWLLWMSVVVLLSFLLIFFI